MKEWSIIESYSYLNTLFILFGYNKSKMKVEVFKQHYYDGDTFKDTNDYILSITAGDFNYDKRLYSFNMFLNEICNEEIHPTGYCTYKLSENAYDKLNAYIKLLNLTL